MYLLVINPQHFVHEKGGKLKNVEYGIAFMLNVTSLVWEKKVWFMVV